MSRQKIDLETQTKGKLSAQNVDFTTFIGEWHTVPFVSGWGLSGSTFEPAKYRKDANGMVYFTGFTNVNPAVSSTTQVATIPAAYRPGSYKFFTVSQNGNTFLVVDINETGALRVRNGANKDQVIPWEFSYLAES